MPHPPCKHLDISLARQLPDPFPRLVLTTVQITRIAPPFFLIVFNSTYSLYALLTEWRPLLSNCQAMKSFTPSRSGICIICLASSVQNVSRTRRSSHCQVPGSIRSLINCSRLFPLGVITLHDHGLGIQGSVQILTLALLE